MFYSIVKANTSCREYNRAELVHVTENNFCSPAAGYSNRVRITFSPPPTNVDLCNIVSLVVFGTTVALSLSDAVYLDELGDGGMISVSLGLLFSTQTLDVNVRSTVPSMM